MQVIEEVVAKHGLAALLQAKPFAGINGLGKHNTWPNAALVPSNTAGMPARPDPPGARRHGRPSHALRCRRGRDNPEHERHARPAPPLPSPRSTGQVDGMGRSAATAASFWFERAA